MKQSKLRRRRVFRYAVLYFVMFVVFMALIIAPSLLGSKIPMDSIRGSLGDSFKGIFQPTGQDNDNTRGETMTGTGDPLYPGKFGPKATATASSSPEERRWVY